jgi:hypothetical protein
MKDPEERRWCSEKIALDIGPQHDKTTTSGGREGLLEASWAQAEAEIQAPLTPPAQKALTSNEWTKTAEGNPIGKITFGQL